MRRALALALLWPMAALAVPPGWLRRPSPLVLSLPFTAPGCYASGTAMGTKGEAVTVARTSDGESIQSGTPVNCAANNTLRVGDSGLLVEPTRFQYVTAPDAPGTETKALTAQNYVARVQGSGSMALTSGTAVATGLPCTATSSNICRFAVTTGGTVTWTVTGSLTFAQIEGTGAGGVLYSSRFHHNWSRAPEDVSVLNPTPVGRWCVAMDAAPFDGQIWQSSDNRGFFDVISGNNVATAYIAASDSLLKMSVKDAANQIRFFASWVFLSSIEHEFRFGSTNAGSSAGDAEIWVDGEQLVLDAPSGAGSGIMSATGPLRIGNSSGIYLNGYAKNVRVHRGACSAIKATPFTVSLVPNSIVAIGDSITGTVSGGGTPYPSLVATQIGWPVLNAALSGRRTDQVKGIWGGGVRRQGHGSVVLMAGINDVMFYGKTAVQAFANIDAIVRQARAEGRRVVLLTVLPARSNINWTAAIEVERLSLNSQIMALCPATGAICIDAATDFDDGTGAMKAAYDGGDGLHPNQAGHNRLRDLVRPAFP